MIEIIRQIKDGNAILGTLKMNSVPICDTLERADKMIPVGVYKMEYGVSPAFTKKRKKTTFLPLIYNDSVPASRGIRIHAGNKIYDSQGCVLVGLHTNYKTLELIDALKAEEMVCYLIDNQLPTEDKYIVISDRT